MSKTDDEKTLTSGGQPVNKTTYYMSPDGSVWALTVDDKGDVVTTKQP